jgi:hypothetical protein
VKLAERPTQQTDYDTKVFYMHYIHQLQSVFFLSGRNLHPGPMHDSKFWRECHLLAPIVGFFHSEKTLVTIGMQVHEQQQTHVHTHDLRNLHPGPMHDNKFWRECHLLAPIVGFSHSEKTLVTIGMQVHEQQRTHVHTHDLKGAHISRGDSHSLDEVEQGHFP